MIDLFILVFWSVYLLLFAFGIVDLLPLLFDLFPCGLGFFVSVFNVVYLTIFLYLVVYFVCACAFFVVLLGCRVFGCLCVTDNFMVASGVCIYVRSSYYYWSVVCVYFVDFVDLIASNGLFTCLNLG